MYFLEQLGDPTTAHGNVASALDYAAGVLAIIDNDVSHIPDSWNVKLEQLDPGKVLQKLQELVDEIQMDV